MCLVGALRLSQLARATPPELEVIARNHANADCLAPVRARLEFAPGTVLPEDLQTCKVTITGDGTNRTATAGCLTCSQGLGGDGFVTAATLYIIDPLPAAAKRRYHVSWDGSPEPPVPVAAMEDGGWSIDSGDFPIRIFLERPAELREMADGMVTAVILAMKAGSADYRLRLLPPASGISRAPHGYGRGGTRQLIVGSPGPCRLASCAAAAELELRFGRCLEVDLAAGETAADYYQAAIVLRLVPLLKRLDIYISRRLDSGLYVRGGFPLHSVEMSPTADNARIRCGGLATALTGDPADGTRIEVLFDQRCRLLRNVADNNRGPFEVLGEEFDFSGYYFLKPFKRRPAGGVLLALQSGFPGLPARFYLDQFDRTRAATCIEIDQDKPGLTAFMLRVDETAHMPGMWLEPNAYDEHMMLLYEIDTPYDETRLSELSDNAAADYEITVGPWSDHS
ncbi:hypothetical protein JW905_06535 [bacterium]|nr:hypothetical protein [candidate division CSSED10-310 bacterium]